MKLMNTTNSHANLVKSQLEVPMLPLLRSIQLVTPMLSLPALPLRVAD